MSNPSYYSQHGEDYILDLIFKNKRDGFFVEVGCIDGLRFSNTYAFEERGWTGVCVEAHSGYIDLLRKNRPNSVVCHCAVGEDNDNEVTFYANDRGSLSTLDASAGDKFKRQFGEYFSGFEEQKVKKRTLTSILDKVGAPSEFEILSLDIEGYEVQALKGLDFSRFRPQVAVIESDNDRHEKEVDELLLSVGYSKTIRIRQNIFYCKDKSLCKNISSGEYEVTLVHTCHPCDDGETSVNKTKVSVRKYTYWNKIKHTVLNILNYIFSILKIII